MYQLQALALVHAVLEKVEVNERRMLRARRDLFENASKKSAYRPSLLTAAISRSKSCINALGGSLAVSKLQLQLQLAAVQPCLMLTIPTRYLLPPRRS
jgi:hypothetical protein